MLTASQTTDHAYAARRIAAHRRRKIVRCDPTIAEIARMTGESTWAVLGRMWALLDWFENNSRDGRIRFVGLSDLERVVGSPVFVAALAETGWIDVDETSITLTMPRASVDEDA